MKCIYDTLGHCVRQVAPAYGHGAGSGPVTAPGWVSAFNYSGDGPGYGDGYFAVALFAFLVGVAVLHRFVLPWALGTIDNRTGKLVAIGGTVAMLWGAAIAARFFVTHDHNGAAFLLSVHEGHRDVLALAGWGAKLIAAMV